MQLDEQEWYLVKVYKALADPMRLRLLRLLAVRGEMGCADLARGLELSRPTLSHHTRVLHDCRLIDVRREGPYHFFRLRREAIARLAPALLAAPEPQGSDAGVARRFPGSS